MSFRFYHFQAKSSCFHTMFLLQNVGFKFKPALSGSRAHTPAFPQLLHLPHSPLPCTHHTALFCTHHTVLFLRDPSVQRGKASSSLGLSTDEMLSLSRTSMAPTLVGVCSPSALDFTVGLLPFWGRSVLKAIEAIHREHMEIPWGLLRHLLVAFVMK